MSALPIDPNLLFTSEVRSLLSKYGLSAQLRLTTELGEPATPHVCARLQRELEEAEQRLNHLRQLAVIGEVSAGVLHEARNLLTGVVGLSLIRSNEESHLELLRSEGARCSKLLTTVLSSASRAPGYPTRLDPFEFVNGIAALLSYEAKSNRCHLVSQVTAEAPSILAYVHELQQVLLNLTINAIQVSPEGGRVVLSTSLTADELSFHVADEGPGVPEEMLEKIFEPFVSGRPPSLGTGLGLSTSRRLVENVGGHLTVSNNPSKGATFTVTVPRRLEIPKSMPPGGNP